MAKDPHLHDRLRILRSVVHGLTIGHLAYGREKWRLRSERAKRLLVKADLPIPMVAQMAGFGSNAYLTDFLQGTLQLSPLSDRKQVRNR